MHVNINNQDDDGSKKKAVVDIDSSMPSSMRTMKVSSTFKLKAGTLLVVR
jgi:hypothetical protein